MDYPIHIDKIGLELCILYSKGLPVKIPVKLCICVPEDCFILADNADPDKMPHCETFHLGVYCLPMYLFIGIRNEIG